ncbi:MAG: DUF5721 family protein [Clostridiales bacterium]|nr:DUF5721 family protein [Clostridiales bacterium]
MISLKMEDLKDFTRQLFLDNTFDGWLVREAVIVTFNVFTIDGHIRQGYYSEEEREQNHIGTLSYWSMLKPFCYSLIRGKKLPESFRMTFQLPSSGVGRFLDKAQLKDETEQIGGLYLHVRYENGGLHCVSGLSLKGFSLDRRMEHEWDRELANWLREKRIPFTEE